jgi:glycosyltransferase involved in cell wall biosynthesis
VDAEVLWPPVQIDNMYHRPDKGFYLSTARVETYKRVELIAEAFSLMGDKTLVITSGGGLLPYLQSKYANYPNIKFTNWVSDDHMRELVAECIATIYLPIDEDFGMSPIESMAAGKPVIGVREGGLMETVSHGDCGYMCRSDPSVVDLITAVEWLTPRRAASMRFACEARARKFSPRIFHSRLAELTSI